MNITQSSRIAHKVLRIASVFVLSLTLLGCGSGDDIDDDKLTIKIDTGSVLGAKSKDANVIEYRGIPYAEAPVGDRRWALPVSKGNLGTGVFDATKFGAACPQEPRYQITDGSTEEDCLTINVTVPADVKPDERLPVVFWIHGGAGVGGSSNLYRLDKLASQGRVVVVSANYRIGILGFMPLSALRGQPVNGNFGIEDQRLAMRWVQRNIAKFGGDPNNVTLAGESAGGASICMHLASPEKTEGLFHKAIIMSFGCLAPMKTMDNIFTEVSEPVENNYLKCTGGDLQCLRSKKVEDILVAQGAFTKDKAKVSTLANPFFTVYGTASEPNATIPRSFKNALETGKFKNVPLLIGGATNELGVYVGYFWQASQQGKSNTAQPFVSPEDNPPVNTKTFDTTWLPFFYKDKWKDVSDKYTPQDGWAKDTQGDIQAAEALSKAISDHNPMIGMSNCLFLHTYDRIRQYPQSSPIYTFEFADPDALVKGVGIGKPYPNFKLGPVHSAILNYIFPNYSNNSKINAPDLPEQSEALAKQIVESWASFATTGKPSVTGVANWPQYSGGETVLKFVPNQVALFNADEAHQCTSFWAKQYPDTLKKPR